MTASQAPATLVSALGGDGRLFCARQAAGPLHADLNARACSAAVRLGLDVRDIFVISGARLLSGTFVADFLAPRLPCVALVVGRAAGHPLLGSSQWMLCNPSPVLQLFTASLPAMRLCTSSRSCRRRA